MTFAQPIVNINLIGADSLAPGSDDKTNDTRVIVGLPGTQSLKSAGDQLLFKVYLDKVLCLLWTLMTLQYMKMYNIIYSSGPLTNTTHGQLSSVSMTSNAAKMNRGPLSKSSRTPTTASTAPRASTTQLAPTSPTNADSEEDSKMQLVNGWTNKTMPVRKR